MKHLVIGAGFAGLGAAAALGRRGVPYEVVEADDDIGGNWYHGVYETAHIISSRRTTGYTDWPMPADWPDFPSAAQMLSYLRAYADHWQIRPHIRLRTRVTAVRPADRAAGTWDVELDTGEVTRFAGVVVANGHHWDRRMPERPGQFSGEMLHSKDYKRPEQLHGKRVLVIGGGNSACDIVSEAARVGASAHLSLRRGYWFMPKTMLGVPSVELLKPWMPVAAQRLVVQALLRVVVGSYESYGLPRPDHRIFEHHPTISTEVLHYLRHGRVTVHPDVARWDGDGVVFTDGVRAAFDLVICATGYHVSVPFVDVVPWRDGIPQLVGLSPLGWKNLYLFGFGQPRYGAGPLVTATAELLATMAEIQPSIQEPISDHLWRCGARPMASFLVDPHAALRECARAERLVRRLPRWERFLRATRAVPAVAR